LSLFTHINPLTLFAFSGGGDDGDAEQAKPDSQEDLPSLSDLTPEKIQALSIQQMQKILANSGVPYDDCVEKEHLVARLTEHLAADSDDEGLADDDWFKTGPQVSREEEATAVSSDAVLIFATPCPLRLQ
jgi:hypothetical protein